MRSLLIEIFYIITIIFVTSVASPVNVNIDFFNNLKTNLTNEITTSCPKLANNPLVDWKSKYFEPCMSAPSRELDDLNLIEYLCLGVLNANDQLCKTLTNKSSDYLPKDNKELDTHIDEIKHNSIKVVCSKLLNYNSSSESFTNYTTQLNTAMASKCVTICTGFIGDTNPLCSMMYFIYTVIDNLKQISVTENPPPNIISKNPVAVEAHFPKSSDKKFVTSSVTPAKPVKTPKQSTPLPQENIVAQTVAHENVAKQTIVEKTPPELHQTEKNTAPVNKNPESGTSLEQNQSKQETQPIPNVMESKVQKTEETEVTSKTTTAKTEIPQDKKENEQQLSPSDDGRDFVADGDPDDDSYVENPSDDKPRDMEIPLDKTGLSNSINPAVSKNNNMGYEDSEDSNFFTYFMFISVLFIGGYIAYHNKQKILALVLEGRRDRNSRRRPNTSNYRKLNSNLEEAVTSKSGGSAAHVIY